MPILPSGGARFIEQNGGSAPSVSAMVLRRTSSSGGVDIYDFTTTGAADLEMVDVSSTGVYTTPAAGSSPSAPRIRARRVSGDSIIVY